LELAVVPMAEAAAGKVVVEMEGMGMADEPQA
jgi:hypothetical protein